MFLRIQNESLKKECIRVRIRGAFLAKKAAPKLNFHREGGGSCPHLPPLNPPLSVINHEKAVPSLVLAMCIRYVGYHSTVASVYQVSLLCLA